MKAVEINKTGGPEVLEVKDISLDKPGPDQVTIEQKAIGLNYIDTYHRSGLYKLKLPSGIGMEGAGIVQEVGPGVTTVKKNDHVVLHWRKSSGIQSPTPKYKWNKKEINALSNQLSDPDFYLNDPDGFLLASENLAIARSELEKYELRWLELEELKTD